MIDIFKFLIHCVLRLNRRSWRNSQELKTSENSLANGIHSKRETLVRIIKNYAVFFFKRHASSLGGYRFVTRASAWHV